VNLSLGKVVELVKRIFGFDDTCQRKFKAYKNKRDTVKREREEIEHSNPKADEFVRFRDFYSFKVEMADDITDLRLDLAKQNTNISWLIRIVWILFIYLIIRAIIG